MTDFDAVKKLATLPVRTVPLCLAGALVDEIAELELQLEQVKPATSLGEASPARAIAEQIEALRVQMREATVEFRLRALRARPWALFYATQPERLKDEPAEEWEPRMFAWQAELVSRSCSDPVMSVEQVVELVELLHGRSWGELVNGAYRLNIGGVDIPNSVAASALIGTSEQM